jgi:hypothetical protein
LFISKIRHPGVILVLDTLIAIFFLCAGIALAAALGGNDCGNSDWTNRNDITNGGSPIANSGKRCREAKALTAFEWFTTATFVATAVTVAVSRVESCRRSAWATG